MPSSSPTLDVSTLASQLKQLAINHDDLLRSLQQREQQVATLQNEIAQYRGALSYSVHVQDQTKKTLEQALAAVASAKMAADSAAGAAEATPPTTTSLPTPL